MMFAFKSKSTFQIDFRASCAASLTVIAALSLPMQASAAQREAAPIAKPAAKPSVKPAARPVARPAPKPEPAPDLKPTAKRATATAVTESAGLQLQLVTEIDGLKVLPKAGHFLGSVNGKNQAGEVQSTLVPPGKNNACPDGRLLISNDARRSPGRIYRFDLDQIGVGNDYATPQALPDTSTDQIASNDHDLVTLTNGDVLLLKMGRSIAALDPKPVWFDYTYKVSSGWGPGARSVMYIWRSEDCGQSFSLRSSVDTALMNDGYGWATDGSGGSPQGDAVTSSPGSVERPVYNMGGTDGPLAMVDRATNNVFYSIGVYGQTPVFSPAGYRLSGFAIDRTTVALSTDRGDSWADDIILPFRGWRTEIVPMLNKRFAFLSGNVWECGRKPNGDKAECWRIHVKDLSAGASASVNSGVDWYIPHGSKWSDISNKSSPGRVDVNGTPVYVVRKQAQPVMARAPSSNSLILAVPEMIGSNGDYGYGLYRVDASGNYSPLSKIAPMQANGKGVVFQLAMVDLGVGPVLIYWYDINAATQKIQMRGRLVTEDYVQTSDFSVSLAFDAPAASASNWFGDYRTAGGFVRGLRQIVPSGPRPGASSTNSPTYEYFPVWKQPDGAIYVSHITYKKPPTPLSFGHNRFTDSLVPRMPVDPEEVQQLSSPGYERRER